MPRILSPALAACLERANPRVKVVAELSVPDVGQVLRRVDQWTEAPTLVSMTPAAALTAGGSGPLQLTDASNTPIANFTSIDSEFDIGARAQDGQLRVRTMRWAVDRTFGRAHLKRFTATVRNAGAAGGVILLPVDISLQIYALAADAVRDVRTGAIVTRYTLAPMLQTPPVIKWSTIPWDGNNRGVVTWDLSNFRLIIDTSPALSPNAAAPAYYFQVTGVGVETDDTVLWQQDNTTAETVTGVGSFHHVVWARNSSVELWQEQDADGIPVASIEIEHYAPAGGQAQAVYALDLGGVPSSANAPDNLVANGDASAGLANFSTFALGSDAAAPSPSACFEVTSTGGATLEADGFIPVDLSKSYLYTVWARNVAGDGKDAYLALRPYDANLVAIAPEQCFVRSATIRHLTQPLNVGDTLVHLDDVTGLDLSNSYLAVDALADLSDLPNRTVQKISNVDLVNKTITLASPSTLARATNTACRWMMSGGTYIYAAAANVALSTTWTKYQGAVQGVIDPIAQLNQGGTFRPGTAYVRPIFLLNRDGTVSTTTHLDDISLVELTGSAGRVVFERAVPTGTTATLELATAGSSGPWSVVTHGDPVAIRQQQYWMRLTVKPDAQGRSTPLISAFGLEFRTPVDVTPESTIAPLSMECSAPWMAAAVGEGSLTVLRTGRRDYEDVATTLGSTASPTALEADLYLASDNPSVTRDDWLLLDRATVTNRVPSGTGEQFALLSKAAKLKRKIPRKIETISTVHTVASATTTAIVVNEQLQGTTASGNEYDSKNYYVRVRSSAQTGIETGTTVIINGNTGQFQLDFSPGLPGVLAAGDEIEVHSGVLVPDTVRWTDADLADIWDELLTVHAEIPDEEIGRGDLPNGGRPPHVADIAPGESSAWPTMRATMQLDSDEEIGELLDQVSFLLGGATVEIGGQLCFVQIYPLRAPSGTVTVMPAPVAATFDARTLIGLQTPVGLDARATEVACDYGVDKTAANQNETQPQTTSWTDVDALNWLTQQDLDLRGTAKVDDKIARWCFNAVTLGGDAGLYLASEAARRPVAAASTGLRVWTWGATEMHPELVPGDSVVVITDQYTDYDPSSQTIIKGMNAYRLVLIGVGSDRRSFTGYMLGLTGNVQRVFGGQAGSPTRRPGVPVILPTMAEATSETATTGTLSLTLTDPQARVSLVEAQAQSGNGAWGSWSTLTAPFIATVTLHDKQPSKIAYRVTGTDALGETGVVLIENVVTFAIGARPLPPEVQVTVASDGTIALKFTGDSDTTGFRYAIATDGATPSDAAARAATLLVATNRTATVANVAQLTAQGQSYRVTVLAYNAAGGESDHTIAGGSWLEVGGTTISFGTPTATQTDITWPYSLGSTTQAADCYALEYTADPGSFPASVEFTGSRVPNTPLTRSHGHSTWYPDSLIDEILGLQVRVPVSAPGNWIVMTAVPRDAFRRGDAVTVVARATQPNAGAITLPPDITGTPTIVGTPGNGTVTIAVPMPASLGTATKIRVYRDGAIYGADVTITVAGGASQNLTHNQGLSSGVTYTFTYKAVDAAGNVSENFSPARAVTMPSQTTQLTAPTSVVSGTYDVGSQSYPYTLTPASGMPPGTIYLAEESVNGGSFNAIGNAFAGANNTVNHPQPPAGSSDDLSQVRVKARCSGYDDSGYTTANTVDIPPAGGQSQ